MKYLYKSFICFFFLMAWGPQLWAKDLSTVLVLPFSVHSAENIDYIRQGIADMLASRLSVNEQIRVVSKDTVLGATKEREGKDLTAADVLSLGKKLNADFAFWGSITKIGGSLSIDGKLVDIAAGKPAIGLSVLCPSMDEVIPKITELAQRIESHMTGSVPTSVVTTPSPKGHRRITTAGSSAGSTSCTGGGNYLGNERGPQRRYFHLGDQSGFHQCRATP